MPRPIAIAAGMASLLLLTGCIGLKSGAEGVFEPTAVQLPPSERSAADRPVAAAERPALERRGLAVPTR